MSANSSIRQFVNSSIAMFIKVCGITRLTDARHAVGEGATALGFVFWPRSPRYIAPERAAEIIGECPLTVTTVGVFVNEPVESVRRIAAEARVTAVQLHGDEPPAYADALALPIFRAVTLDTATAACTRWTPETTLLLDASDPERRGGTGLTVDWVRAAQLARLRRIVLAGGLTPANVGEAIAAVLPYGVDVSSGVEASPGVKDLTKVAQFLAGARQAFGKG
jgi:phosphoribosylanthranilate isomerase